MRAIARVPRSSRHGDRTDRSRTAGAAPAGTTTRTATYGHGTTELASGWRASSRSPWARGARRLRRWGRRRVRHVRRVTTPLGWTVLLSAALSLPAGAFLGWVELVTIGAVLWAVALISALFLLGAPGYEVDMEVTRTRTTVGEAVPGILRLRRRRRGALWGAGVEIVIGGESVPLPTPARRGAGTAESAFEVPARHRGVVQVGPVRTVRGDPVGLFRRTLEWTESVNIFVHPEIISVPSMSAGFVRDLEGSPTRDLTASDISFQSLRDYRAGDDRRHIHWKATARVGTLTVRQFEETRRSHIVVALASALGDYSSGAEFELAVSAAGSIAMRALRDGRDVSVLAGPPTASIGEEPARSASAGEESVRAVSVLNTRGRDPLLDDLSEREWGDTPRGLGELAMLAAESIPGMSLIFLVCGSTPNLRELRSWSLRFPLGTSVVAVICAPEQPPRMRRIQELRVVDIGYLGDIRDALTRAARV
ncbi:DUF58 domain-containing protein [Mycetocola tolaasinivorans]|uniref:DUF58 domain-containing protein n=1 Tax=Mycetocola tolaasinivorans TaxID=76635 RepID=A0A3L7A9M8_9MICO|nr:DUF58 domain-containing protein [Mycetocola tolaasinivorans]RLP76082.1 DUF58 domain-containing protein [Mycetocola tolaasinivorans]